jgi:hypothetical protein
MSALLHRVSKESHPLRHSSLELISFTEWCLSTSRQRAGDCAVTKTQSVYDASGLAQKVVVLRTSLPHPSHGGRVALPVIASGAAG